MRVEGQNNPPTATASCNIHRGSPFQKGILTDANMGKSGGGYYAVALGRRTGIFTTWSDAEAQVKGFNGARFKKFPTQLQAEAFLVQHGASGSASNPPTPTTHTTAPAVSDPATRKRGRSIDNLEDGGVAAESSSSASSAPEAKKANMGTKSGSFYAVLEGHSTGVYTTWAEVQKQTKGFDRPLYRKFETQVAAQAYLSGYAQAREPAKQFVTVLDSPHGSDQGETSGSSSTDGVARGGSWYAVAKGRKTGVFDSWADAKVQIDGLFSAKYKKFATKEEAEAFVRDHQVAVTNQPGDPDPKHPDSLVAFCDGSALQNGRFGCQAGYACIFPHNPSWNVAKKLVEARATNNRAEYLAALEGMKRANQEDPSQKQPLYIFSDSMLLIRSMTEWVASWKKKNWVKADGNPVLNRDLLELLLEEKGGRRIIWRHVKAHTGKKDWHSKWNDVADHAARNAAAGWEPTSSA